MKTYGVLFSTKIGYVNFLRICFYVFFISTITFIGLSGARCFQLSDVDDDFFVIPLLVLRGHTKSLGPRETTTTLHNVATNSVP